MSLSGRLTTEVNASRASRNNRQARLWQYRESPLERRDAKPLESIEILVDLRQPFHMDIDLTGFSAPQQRALFDLLVLAMYADTHLTNVEDEQLQKWLTTFGYTEEYARQRELDAAVTRMRPFVQSIQTAKEQALLLAEAFTTRGQQKQVYEAVQRIMTSDKHVSAWENTLLSELALKFRM